MPPTILVTKTSVTPAGSKGGLNCPRTPGVVGKSGAVEQGAAAHVVEPVTYAAPRLSSAIALPTSVPRPPRNVEYRRRLPVLSRLVTKASRPPPISGCDTPP